MWGKKYELLTDLRKRSREPLPCSSAIIVQGFLQQKLSCTAYLAAANFSTFKSPVTQGRSTFLCSSCKTEEAQPQVKWLVWHHCLGDARA